MTTPEFIWDPAKAAANVRKHGVTFSEAQTVFSDEAALLLDDPEYSEAEDDRFILLGLSVAVRLLVVVHCYRDDEDTIRIISARKATRNERRQYNDRRLR